jgi:predicted membrane-bound dolichyl-phosphate-mannose-protein mannosyltransferase
MKRLDLVFWISLTIITAVYTYYTVTTFAFINNYISDEAYYPASAYNILDYVFHVQPRLISPWTPANVTGYVNPEHPPLAKYIMGVFELAFGYQFVAFRAPSWILGDLLLVVVALTVRKLIGTEPWASVFGIAGAIVTALDPILWVLHGAAMLEIYVAFFSITAFYFLVTDRPLLASIFLGLAFSAKESSYFLLLPFLFYTTYWFRDVARRVLYGIVIPIAVYLVLAIPIMVYFGGIYGWLQHSFLHEVSWDLTSGHIASSATNQISEPWDWFLNINPFYMGTYDTPSGKVNLYAATSPPILLAWIPVSILNLAFVRNLKLSVITASGWIFWASFVLVYLGGNTTLFSFYEADFEPFVIVTVVAGAYMITRKAIDLVASRRGVHEGQEGGDNGGGKGQ